MKSSTPLTSVFGRGLGRHAPAISLLIAVSGAIAFGGRVEGYSHAQYPLALLGAPPLPQAGWFNLLVFAIPGIVAAGVALGLRSCLTGTAARWPARIGAQLMLMAALAFAAQGMLPLDASELDGAQNGRHAAAWMVWLIASCVGSALLGIGLRRAGRPWSAPANAYLMVAMFLPVIALVLPQLFPAGITQRLAFLLWFAMTLGTGRLVAGTATQP